MDVFEAMQNRRSIRKYTDQKVSREDLVMVLEAARIAPSWRDMQCWTYIVVSDRQMIAQIGEKLKYNPSRNAHENATYLLVLCADPKLSGDMDGKQYYMTDAAISMQQAMLAAESLGLGTCWIGWFSEEAVKSLLDIPDDVKVIALTPLGFPAESPEQRDRKDLEEIVFSGRWGVPFR